MHTYKHYQLTFLCLLIMFLAGCATTNYSQRSDVHEFIDRMSTKHHFDREELCALFRHVKCEPKIISAMEKPRERKATPWCAYRAVFLTPEKIKQGVQFWQKNAQTLTKVEQQYGVPAEIIVAIIGVETQYGKNKGNFRVIDALTNLAFDYPRRSHYFCGELEQYLLLTREQNLDPLEPVGSYAGAIVNRSLCQAAIVVMALIFLVIITLIYAIILLMRLPALLIISKRMVGNRRTSGDAR